MAAGHVQVAPDGAGKDVDAVSIVSSEAGTPTVYRQVVVLGDPTAYGSEATVTGSGALKVDATATTQPISGTVSIGVGSNVIGHVVVDSGSATAITGNVTVVQATGTNLHVVVDSAPSTAVTGTVTANAGTNLNTSLLALEAGGNLAQIAAAAVVNDATTEPTRVIAVAGESNDVTPIYAAIPLGLGGVSVIVDDSSTAQALLDVTKNVSQQLAQLNLMFATVFSPNADLGTLMQQRTNLDAVRMN